MPISHFKNYIIAALLLCFLSVAFIFSIISGPLSITAHDSFLSISDSIFNTQVSSLDDYKKIIITELRLPRTLLAIFIGSILAQCGAVTQGVFRNFLADPGVIGVTSGAAVGAVIAIITTPTEINFLTIPIYAFVSGLITTYIVYLLAQSKKGTSIIVLLLAGIAISAMAGALIGFLTYFSNNLELRELTLWQMGSLNKSSHSSIILAFITMVSLAIIFQRYASTLNVMLLGETEARHLGIPIEQVKLQLMALIAIGMGIAVACSGIIGFVGLVVPHWIRLLCGPNHHSLLPLSALAGSLLLLLSDIFSRTAVSPSEMPVGLVTALIGAPFFIFLLLQQKKSLSY